MTTYIENVWKSLDFHTGNEASESTGGHNINTTAAILSSMAVVSIIGVGIGCIFRRRKDWVLFTDLTPKNDRKENHECPIIESRFEESPSDDAGSSSVDHSFLSRVLYSVSMESDENPSNLLSRMSENFDTIKLEATEEEEDETSPLSPANFIPPMIVINNIEEDEVPLTSREVGGDENDENSEIKKGLDDENGIQVKHIEASSALAAALSSQRMNNPLPAYNLLW